MLNHLEYIRRTVKYLTHANLLVAGLALIASIVILGEKQPFLSAFLIIFGGSTLWLSGRLNRYWHVLDEALEKSGTPLDDDSLKGAERRHWDAQRIYASIQLALLASLLLIAGAGFVMAVLHKSTVGIF